MIMFFSPFGRWSFKKEYFDYCRVALITRVVATALSIRITIDVNGRTVWKGTRAEAACEIRKKLDKRTHRFSKDLRWASNAFYATHDFPGDPGMTEESLYLALKETRAKRKSTTNRAANGLPSTVTIPVLGAEIEKHTG